MGRRGKGRGRDSLGQTALKREPDTELSLTTPKSQPRGPYQSKNQESDAELDCATQVSHSKESLNHSPLSETEELGLKPPCSHYKLYCLWSLVILLASLPVTT